MALPVPQDIRDMLEGYGIDTTQVSDSWINGRMTNQVIPHINRTCRTSLTGVQTVTDYYSGTNENYLILHRKDIQSIVDIQFVVGGGQWVFNINMVELIADEGIIKAKRNLNEAFIRPYFPKGTKNIKVTYTVGYDPANIPVDLKEAVVLLTCDLVLTIIAGRTGGGDVSIQQYSKTYGSRGKYSQIRNELVRQADSILRYYITGVI